MRGVLAIFLVHLAAKLNSWSEKLFTKGVSLAISAYEPTSEKKSITEPEPRVAELPQEPVALPKNKLKEASEKLKPEEVPLFSGPDGEPIPLILDELPDQEIFKAMFTRKYGPNGVCPLTIGGRSKTFDQQKLYDLLKKISEQEDLTPMHIALYGTVMNVIMHAYGEDFEDSDWN